jgi:predicted TIM-barrel fold metal-dependent hydrolase
LKRRSFIYGAGVLAGAGALGAWRFWPEQGVWNPCLARLPRRLAEHDLVRSAWDGIDPTRVWDSHAHLVGTGDSGSGIVINPRMESLMHPGQYARRLFFLNAGCAYDSPGGVDRAYVERLHNLLEGMPAGVKLLLYAFDRAHDEHGAPDDEHSGLYVPDAYARDVARALPQRLEWVASIHPYRKDALEALALAKKEGARGVKWLPSAMGIDPSSPRCDRFYSLLERSNVPLIVHAGLERAVLGREMHDYGNPLRLRRALDAGVRVVVAHCASMGQDRDLDQGPQGPMVDSFSLFARLMTEKRFEKHLYGDISAMTQVNRAGSALAQVVERTDWHGRLLNGSDYPLPGVMPIFSVDYLINIGLIDKESGPVLTEIRQHNPLLFDLVLKRRLRSRGKALSRQVFETRPFFEASVRKT